MPEREVVGKNYWKEMAYSGFGPSSILLPDGEVRRLVPGYVLPKFIRNMVKDLNLRKIQGNILDICGGSTTRSFFPKGVVKERRLIGVDISEKALHVGDEIRPFWDQDTQGPLDLAIVADLEEKRLAKLGIASESLALATLIRAWRYFKVETLKQITQDTFDLLAPQGILLVADLPRLNVTSEISSQMGEIRIFDKQEQGEVKQIFESAGFQEVTQRDIHDEDGWRLYFHLVMGRKPA